MNQTQTADNGYFEKYYRTHKDQISERRKQKYSEDEEYRQRCIERAKARYQDKRDEIRKKSKKVPYVIWLDGRKEEAFQLSEFSVGIGKAPFTVRKWIRDGMIPDSPIKKNGIRYYTHRMIVTVKKALPKSFRKDWVSIQAKIKAGWEACGAYDQDLKVESG